MKLIEILKFFSLLLVLFILLFIIYFFTNKKHFKNEYFTVPDNLLKDSLADSEKQKKVASETKDFAHQNLLTMGQLNKERKESVEQKINNLNQINNEVNTMKGHINKVNQKLFNLRNGDLFSDNPIDRVGIFDTTLII